MLCVVKPSKALLLSLSLAVTYQYLLSTGLQDFILRPGAREDSFLSANREGIFSLFGYMSLYFAGVAIGRFLFQSKRLTDILQQFVVKQSCLCSCSWLPLYGALRKYFTHGLFADTIIDHFSNRQLCLFTIYNTVIQHVVMPFFQ